MVVADVNDSGFVWLNQGEPYNWNVTIDGVSIIADVLSFEVIKSATFSIGTFNMLLNNNIGSYNKLVGGEEVKFYMDKGTATTVVFRGIIDKPEKNMGSDGFVVSVDGRHISYPLTELSAIKTYNNSTVSDIAIDLINTYLPAFTYNNIETISTQMTVNWIHKPLLDCFVELCKVGNCDYYIDNDKDFHLFVRNSKLCTTEAITSQNYGNTLEFQMFGFDKTAQKNKIIVYGKDNEGITIIVTSEDTTMQTSGIRENVIYDSSLRTYEACKSRADSELSYNQLMASRAEISTTWITSAEPGSLIWVSVPENDIHGKYLISQISHTYPNLVSKVTIFAEHTNLANLFKDFKARNEQTMDIDNPFGMEQSYNFTFDDSTNLINANTMISNGSLLISTGTTGTCQSLFRSLITDATQCHLVVYGQDYASCLFYVTADGGSSWESITPNAQATHTFTSPGKSIGWKVTLISNGSNPNPMLNSLSLKYK